MTKMEELQRLEAQLQAKMKESGAEAVVEELEQIFSAMPGLQGIAWDQYTPYFNDGEACYFGLRDYRFGFKVGGEPYVWQDDWKGSEKVVPDIIYNETGRVLRDIPEQLLLKCFGDHVRVFLSRDGSVTTEEVDHD